MASSMPVLSPKETKQFILDCLETRQVPYIAGEPAIGKSDVVDDAVKEINLLKIDMRLSQKLSEDMTGMPERDEAKGKAVYLPFEDIPVVGDTVPKGYDGWALFLDELSSASEEVLAATYSILLDHRVGGHDIHPRCLVVAAGNRAKDSAIARELPDTLITRMLPITMEVSVPDWLAWANKSTHRNEFVIDFIEKNPTMLLNSKEDREELEAYRNPRSWAKVMRFMNLHEKRSSVIITEDSNGIPMKSPVTTTAEIPDSIYYLINSAVGSKGARDLRDQYNEAIKIPYPWEVAQSPSSTRVPVSTTGKAQIVNILAEFFIEQNDESRENVMTYMNRLGGEWSVLFQNKIKDSLGSTASDIKLVEHIQERLAIDPLLNTAPVPGGDDGYIPF